MKLEFNEITTVTKCYSTKELSGFSWYGATAINPLSCEYSVVKEDKQSVRFAGALSGIYIVNCDRCGIDVEVDLATDFSYLVTTKEEEISDLQEVECDFDDLMTVYVDEPVVDVEALLNEQADLIVPMQVVCSDDCKGLCANCGVALNSESCKCDPNETDSPFAVLKKLSQR